MALEHVFESFNRREAELLAVAREQLYHMVKMSERKYGVVHVKGYGLPKQDIFVVPCDEVNKPYLNLYFVPGLERVTFKVATNAVTDLNAGRTKPDDYCPPEE